MLRIACISDLHVDHTGDGGKKIISMIDKHKDAFDVMVIAGDISNFATEAFEFLRKVSDILYRNQRNQTIFFVPGNHEYYNFEMPWVDGVFDNLQGLRNVRVMKDGTSSTTIFHDEECFLFVGGTLWTDFELYGQARLHKNEAILRMSDFNRIITPDDKILHPDDTVKMFDQTTLAMSHQVFNRHLGAKVVAVTHHCPSSESVAPQYRNNALTPAFASGLLDMDHPSYQSWTMLVDLWIHGHTHTSFDYEVDHGDSRTRVVCNPLGYPMRGGGFENQKFSLVIVTL